MADCCIWLSRFVVWLVRSAEIIVSNWQKRRRPSTWRFLGLRMVVIADAGGKRRKQFWHSKLHPCFSEWNCLLRASRACEQSRVIQIDRSLSMWTVEPLNVNKHLYSVNKHSLLPLIRNQILKHKKESDKFYFTYEWHSRTANKKLSNIQNWDPISFNCTDLRSYSGAKEKFNSVNSKLRNIQIPWKVFWIELDSQEYYDVTINFRNSLQARERIELLWRYILAVWVEWLSGYAREFTKSCR